MNDAVNYLIVQKNKRSSIILYIDVPDSMGDRSLQKYDIPVRFDSDYVSDKEPYKLVSCKIRNKYLASFALAMKDLYNSMIICGYEGFIEQFQQWTANIQTT